jgi:hypothetical protein
MNKAIEISMMPNLREEVSTHKLQIKKFVPYVPNMTIPRSVPPPGRNTQSKIKQTSNPMPSIRSNTRWMGVPVNPLAWHPHFFSLASRRAAKAELKKSGRIPMAGLTASATIPWIRRTRNAGAKVASDMARRAWGTDLVKIVKFRTGPAMMAVFAIVDERERI